MHAKLFNKNHECSHMQTITKRGPNVYRGYGVCSGATWQEEGGSRGGQTEARNGIAPLQRFLNYFQRPTTQITETKTTLTSGRAIRRTCLQYSSADIISCVLSH